MKLSAILVVLCVASGTLAKPGSPPSFLEYKDTLGQYSFGYSAPGSARSEVRALDGSTRGSYSYVDGAGVIQSAQYTADGENGFQVVATNLPRAPSPVVDTPEVVAARLEHLRAIEAARKLAGDVPEARETKIDGRNVDAVVIEGAAVSADDEARGRVQKSDASETKPEGIESAGIQTGVSGGEREAAVVENEVGSSQGIGNAAAGGAQQVQSQSRAALQSDVPVVTTSFVIPGSVNLHNRIELVPSGTVRSSSESSALPLSQPSMIQGSQFDSSMMTPASTTLMDSSEKDAALIKTARLPDAQIPEESKIYRPQLYSVPVVPRFAHANIIALPYAVGHSPIYPQYNSYRFYPIGVL